LRGPLLISSDYRAQQRELHERNANYGTGGHRWATAVKTYAMRFGCLSILDYGAGPGRLHQALAGEGFDFRDYDPAMPGIDTPPEPADMVTCCDAMEHVEPECIDAVLDHIQSLARKMVYFVIPSSHSLKTLADGRNAHLTQQPLEWWLPKIEARWPKVVNAHMVGIDSIIVARAA